MLKFLCDGMLGRIARWLRLLGCDTSYSSLDDDKKLIEIAKKEKRILLTKDLELYKSALKNRIQAFLVKGDSFEIMLAQIISHFNITPEIIPELSRCPECNGEMQHVSASDIKKLNFNLPETTLKVYKDFWICKVCHKTYWKGRMWNNMTKTLEKVKEKMKNNLDVS